MTGELDRGAALRRLRTESFDILVIGGGITGAGVALDAAARGLRTALVERDDFASGTSSRSSKLVHGGFRYLQHGEIRLVHEALYERQRALENAAHLVRVLPFLVPVFHQGGVVSRRLAPMVRAALWAYDVTGGLRIGRRHQRLSVEAALSHMPTIAPERLSGAYVLYDAHADDARLTLAVVRTAAARGAVVTNYARVSELLKDRDRVVGARVRVDEDDVDVTASCVVNATGVWADEVRALEHDDLSASTGPASIRPAKGVHIALPRARVANDIAVILPVAADRRTVFVVPWGSFTYVGTTDTDYDGPLDAPACTGGDVDYLLGALNDAVRDPIGRDEVVGTWAGLRPLVRGEPRARTADLSRRHAVQISAGGVVTVTGGKLTTYRKMAADTVDAAVRRWGWSVGGSTTAHLRLVGADGVEPASAALTYEPDGETPGPNRLARRYGTEDLAVAALAKTDPALGEPLVPGLPYLKAEAVFAVREEMARTLGDILERRTRARVLARDASASAADDVARLVAPELGWTESAVRAQVDRYRASVAAERELLVR